MRTLKKVNTFFLIVIVLLVLIDILFADFISGIWNKIFILLLTLSLVISVVVEIAIKRRKRKS
ncbi:MAG: hypothetical protein KJ578_11380 [Bacteroidetes bacterium]|nr:hypothetical protein [Bacteroidota bacterium]MBU1579033.1 hypothetical protein [Bacteroidota bacterium]MBU2465768.1 hypothetical protein [Bacteroidota bacterium]MBU2558370.1 hypothetical protein [Bacteroidota bacterium]